MAELDLAAARTAPAAKDKSRLPLFDVQTRNATAGDADALESAGDQHAPIGLGVHRSQISRLHPIVIPLIISQAK